MTSFKNICLLLFAILISVIFISCFENGPVEPEEPENQLAIDSELIGTWKGLGILPRTLTFEQISQIEGSGIKITEDYYGNCENVTADYLTRIDFKWTQTRKKKEGWSAIYYEETVSLECGGAERNSRLAFEREYLIQGNTLFLGTADYSTYVRGE